MKRDRRAGTLPSGELMEAAIALSFQGMRRGKGGPFGALVARGGRIIARGYNRVTSDCDPTAHAEITAIRKACRALGVFSLAGCELYSSCEPCPMCLAAAYWARLDRVIFGNTRRQASAIGFSDARIYRELGRKDGRPSLPLLRFMAKEASGAFAEWRGKADRVEY